MDKSYLQKWIMNRLPCYPIMVRLEIKGCISQSAKWNIILSIPKSCYFTLWRFFCIVSRWFDKLWQTSWWHKHIFVFWRIFKWENNLNPWKIWPSQPEVSGVLAECWPNVCTRWPSHVPHIVMTSHHTAGSRPVNQGEKSDTRYRLVQTRTLEALIFLYKPRHHFFSNHHKCLSQLFPLHLNASQYVMGPRPL